MKKAILTITAVFLALCAYAQDIEFISELPNDFDVLDTLPRPQKYKSRHMIGVQYYFNFCSVRANPSVGQGYITAPLNFGVMYTYYHPLWDEMNLFGLKFGAKFGEEGYKAENEKYGERCKVLEFPLISQFKIDFSRFRFLINLGTYYGYRLKTDKPGGFDKYDQRHDYGILAGAGLGIVFDPVEVHIEGNYKLSLASMYHPNKNGEMYWILAYPSTIMVSAGVFINLW